MDVKHMPGKEVVCETCGMVMPSQSRLKTHILTKHKRKPSAKIECKECKKVYRTRYTYLTHYCSAHLKIEDIDKFPHKVHTCHICSKLFLDPRKLETHIRTHTGEKPEICEFCSRGFSDRANLLQHLKIHNDEKMYACDICGKRFILNRGLRKHMESHEAGNIPEKKPELEPAGGKMGRSVVNVGGHEEAEDMAVDYRQETAHPMYDMPYARNNALQFVWGNAACAGHDDVRFMQLQ